MIHIAVANLVADLPHTFHGLLAIHQRNQSTAIIQKALELMLGQVFEFGKLRWNDGHWSVQLVVFRLQKIIPQKKIKDLIDKQPTFLVEFTVVGSVLARVLFTTSS